MDHNLPESGVGDDVVGHSQDVSEVATTELPAQTPGYSHTTKTFGFSRRPKQLAEPASTEGESILGSKPSQLYHKESKGGLRAIFKRTKVQEPNFAPSPLNEHHNIQEKELPDLPGQKFGQKSEMPSAEPNRFMSKKVLFYKRPQTAAGLEISTEDTLSTATGSTNPAKSQRSAQKSPTSSSRKQFIRRPKLSHSTWDPPPLFKAYPQAVKHATLTASTLSADAVLRISNYKNSIKREQDAGEALPSATDAEGSATTQKFEKTRKNKHRRHVSGSISKADWTQKIYVLVTSGYLLQYSCNGPFDRLPERIMQLGKNSVAFASDVIPGKHWVLQISQSMDTNGTPTPDARSFFSRISFRGTDYRKAATSLLLILDSAEDLEAWITVVRHEIEALGGKKSFSETGNSSTDDHATPFRDPLSPRSFVQRDRDRLSRSITIGSDTCDHPPSTVSEDGRLNSMNKDSIRPRPTIDSTSTIASSASRNNQQERYPRDDIYKNSLMSAERKISIPSHTSSSAHSPTRNPSGRKNLSLPMRHVSRSRPSTQYNGDRRRSLQTMQDSISGMPVISQATRPRPQSAYAGRPRNSQIAPQPVQNFSMPQTASQIDSSRIQEIRRSHTVPLSVLIPGKRYGATPGDRTVPPIPSVPQTLLPVNDQSSEYFVNKKRMYPRHAAKGPSSKSMQNLAPNPMLSSSHNTTLPHQPNNALCSLGTKRTDSDISNKESVMIIGRPMTAQSSDESSAPLSPRMVPLPPSPSSPTRSQAPMSLIPRVFEDSPGRSSPQSVLETRRAARRTSGRVPTSTRLNASMHPPKSTRDLSSAAPLPTISSVKPTMAGTMPRKSAAVKEQSAKHTRPVSRSSTTPSISQAPHLLPINPNLSIRKSPSASRLDDSPPVDNFPTPPCTAEVHSNSEPPVNLINRRSMPLLVTSPPPAPPPTSALPPLPPRQSSHDSTSKMRPTASLRTAVRTQ